MKLFQGLTAFLLATNVMAIAIGDYVDFTDKNSLSPEYGTVVAESNGLLKIRPHIYQGDFSSSRDQLKLIKDKAAIEALKPKPGEYTINLMWVNAGPTGQYVFRDHDLLDNLAKVVAWARHNPIAQVVVWYDSATLDQKAVPNTIETIAKNFPGYEQQIVFKDLRQFPEVLANPQAFSSEVPLYFRVDLLRVICAYNVLMEATKHGQRHYFVYADIDVTPMSKDELFDASAQMDLEKYGIVMARGGNNGYENSFQTWSNNQPHLLAAAKAAIIDINLLRALKASPQSQDVYMSYPAMFRFFYHLQRWGVAGFGNSDEKMGYSPVLEPLQTMQIFGLRQEGNTLGFEVNNPELNEYPQGFGRWDGKKYGPAAKKLYIPTKIIEAPTSQFGGRPTLFDPNKLSQRNFAEKFREALTVIPFNSYLLLVAARNNDVPSVAQITETLSTKALSDAALKPSAGDMYSSIPLIAALDEGHDQVSQILVGKIIDAKSLEMAAKAISSDRYKGERLLSKLIQAKDASFTRLLRALAPHPEVLETIFGLVRDEHTKKALANMLGAEQKSE